MAKKRTRNQQLEQESRSKFSLIFSPWIVNDLPNDFGLDFEVRITEKDTDVANQVVTGLSFYAQLKATENEADDYYCDLETTDIKLYCDTNIPVLIAKYYSKFDVFFYEIIQIYTWDVIERRNPKWQDQSSNRIRFRKKIGEISEIKKDIFEAQKRIIRKSNYNLGLGEGFSFSELDSLREIDLSEFKFKTTLEGFSKIREGDVESGIKLLQEAYAVKRDDLLTLNVCFNLILHLNSLNPTNHSKIKQYVSDGKKIAKELNLSGFVALFKIVECQVLLIQNIISLSQVLLTRKINELQKEALMELLIQKDVLILYNIQQRIILKIGEFLNQLIRNKDYFELTISLIILLESITFQVQRLGFIREDFVELESKHRHPFISVLEGIFSKLTDRQLQQLAFCKLGIYYFSICDYEKAERYTKSSIKIAHELGNIGAEKELNLILEDIIQQKNPYDPKNKMQEEEINNMTFSQIKQFLIRQMELQGFDLSKTNDQKIDVINLAISDSDPTQYLKHCEQLRISYYNTSMFGKMIGLPALGQKVVWCNNAKKIASGLSLKTVFNSFVRENCIDCTQIRPRGDQWTCTYGEFVILLNDPDFQEFLKNFYKINSAEDSNNS